MPIALSRVLFHDLSGKQQFFLVASEAGGHSHQQAPTGRVGESPQATVLTDEAGDPEVAGFRGELERETADAAGKVWPVVGPVPLPQFLRQFIPPNTRQGMTAKPSPSFLFANRFVRES